ncbi:MAG: sporulation protein [Parasporobacterium sp.]|nr:sporulation protein [Parasporobacterium sp.]
MAGNFEQTVEALANSLETRLSTKTIMGEPIKLNDTYIFPMAEVSFGITAGSFVQDKKNNGVGGVGGKVTPSALLVISGNTSKIINIKEKDSINKLIDLIPEALGKFTEIFGKSKEEVEAELAEEK